MKHVFLFAFACFFVTMINAQEKTKTTTEKTKAKKEHGMSMSKMNDCVMMEDGKMMTMMGGKTMTMDKDMTMKNGTTVMTDGTVKMKNGKTTMLKNGDCVYMDGRFHRKMKSSSKKME